MLLKELLGYDDLKKQFDYDPKNGQTKTKWNISDYLKSYGWWEKGTGRRGSVYWKKGTDFVLKIFSNDDCYKQYIDFVKQHSNPHFPKVYGMIKFPKFENLYAVKLEILNPLPKSEFDKNIGFHLYILSKIENRYSKYIIDNKKNLERMFPFILKKFQEENQSLCVALDLIFENFKNDCSSDIHYENVMIKTDGTWVIIDPVEPS